MSRTDPEWMTPIEIANETGRNVQSVRRELFAAFSTPDQIGRTVGNGYFWLVSRLEFELVWKGAKPQKGDKERIANWNKMPLKTMREVAEEAGYNERWMREVANRMPESNRPYKASFGDKMMVWLVDQKQEAALLEEARKISKAPSVASKLTPAQVKCIRRSKKSLSELAKQYGVVPSTISRIKARDSYRGV